MGESRMKVGIIAPIKFLEYCVTDIQYCLPSLLIKSKEYRDFYLGKKEEGNFLVMDCRQVGWKRVPEDFSIVEEALSMLKPSIIIAPSYMFNAEASNEVYGKFVEKFDSWSKRIIRCLEGASESDIKVDKSERIAVPSHMYRFLSKFPETNPIIYIDNHLNLEELEGREGILVTSLPIRLGLKGRLLVDYKPTPESLTFYETRNKYPEIVERNVLDTIEFYEE